MIGNGKNLHHPIFVDDLTQGLHLASVTDEAIGKLFVLSGKEPVTTNSMVATIAEEVGTAVRNFHAPLLPFQVAAVVAANTFGVVGIQPPIHPRRLDFFTKSFVFSSEHASKTLGFAPENTFKHGVHQTAQWYTEIGHL